VNERSVEIPWLLSKVGVPRRVLDVGAADATYLSDLAKRAGMVGGLAYAIDTRMFDAPPGIIFEVCNAAAMPAEWSGTFDCVTCVSTLDHIGLAAYGNAPNPGACLRVTNEIWRVTAPGGRLLLTVPFGADRVTKFSAGMQRVFGGAALAWLFQAPLDEPRDSRWKWLNVQVFRLIDEVYVASNLLACWECQYLEDRAEAVLCAELQRC